MLLEMRKAQRTLDTALETAKKLPVTEPSRAARIVRYNALKREVNKAYDALIENSATYWADQVIPDLYGQGVLQGVSQLDIPIQFEVLHHGAAKVLMDDAFDDVATGLLQVPRNFSETIERAKSFESLASNRKELIRLAAREGLAQQLLTGELSPADVARILRDRLWVDGIKIIDRGGRRWSPEAYTRMLVRTKSAMAYNTGSLNVFGMEGVARVAVFDGEEHDDVCARANGQTWSIDYAAEHVLAHPNCRRAFGPVPGKGPVNQMTQKEVSKVLARVSAPLLTLRLLGSNAFVKRMEKTRKLKLNEEAKLWSREVWQKIEELEPLPLVPAVIHADTLAAEIDKVLEPVFTRAEEKAYAAATAKSDVIDFKKAASNVRDRIEPPRRPDRFIPHVVTTQDEVNDFAAELQGLFKQYGDDTRVSPLVSVLADRTTTLRTWLTQQSFDDKDRLLEQVDALLRILDEVKAGVLYITAGFTERVDESTRVMSALILSLAPFANVVALETGIDVADHQLWVDAWDSLVEKIARDEYVDARSQHFIDWLALTFQGQGRVVRQWDEGGQNAKFMTVDDKFFVKRFGAVESHSHSIPGVERWQAIVADGLGRVNTQHPVALFTTPGSGTEGILVSEISLHRNQGGEWLYPWHDVFDVDETLTLMVADFDSLLQVHLINLLTFEADQHVYNVHVRRLPNGTLEILPVDHELSMSWHTNVSNVLARTSGTHTWALDELNRQLKEILRGYQEGELDRRLAESFLELVLPVEIKVKIKYEEAQRVLQRNMNFMDNVIVDIDGTAVHLTVEAGETYHLPSFRLIATSDSRWIFPGIVGTVSYAGDGNTLVTVAMPTVYLDVAQINWVRDLLTGALDSEFLHAAIDAYADAQLNNPQAYWEIIDTFRTQYAFDNVLPAEIVIARVVDINLKKLKYYTRQLIRGGAISLNERVISWDNFTGNVRVELGVPWTGVTRSGELVEGVPIHLIVDILPSGEIQRAILLLQHHKDAKRSTTKRLVWEGEL